LLDEIEKAHSDVFNILLQVLDDGRLTDGHGRTVDFKNTVLVMTSNLGSGLIQSMTQARGGDSDGNSNQEMKDAVMKVVGQYFRPEFLNRIDDAVVFHPLNKSQIQDITRIQLGELQNRLADAEIGLHLDESAITFLVEVGYDPNGTYLRISL